LTALVIISIIVAQ